MLFVFYKLQQVVTYNSIPMRYLILFFCLVLGSCGGDTPEGLVYAVDGVAMEGYDFVAFFKDLKAVKGDEKYTSQIDGIKYYFSSQKNKEEFDAEPDKYLPRYGGWCAYAISNGDKMEPDPVNFLIDDGDLLFFYADWQTSLFGDLKGKWNKDPEGNKKKADENWPKIN